MEAPEGLWDGHLVPLPSGEFAVVQDGLQVPFATPRTIRAELRALCGLRDRAKRLLRAEAESFTDTPAIDTERALLRGDYQEYVRRWGPINRFTERRTGRTDPETGEERTARIMPPAVRALRGDPFAPLVHRPRGVRRGDRPGAAGGAAARASRRAPRAGSRRRHPAGRAGGLPGLPRARRA